MRKIHLKIESLAVESFVTDDVGGGPGTVRAHAETDLCQRTMGNISMCVRQRTEYETCYVDCTCTNLYVKCAPVG